MHIYSSLDSNDFSNLDGFVADADAKRARFIVSNGEFVDGILSTHDSQSNLKSMGFDVDKHLISKNYDITSLHSDISKTSSSLPEAVPLDKIQVFIKFQIIYLFGYIDEISILFFK